MMKGKWESKKFGHSKDSVIKAIKQGKLNEVQKTISKVGFKFSGSWLEGYFLLQTAIKHRQKKITAWLLTKGCTVNRLYENDLSNTPLHLATCNNDFFLVKSLLEKNACVVARNFNGETPLYMSCQMKNVEITRILLEKSNEADIADDNLTTPLHIATIEQCPVVIELLLNHKIEMNSYTIRSDLMGFTPLHIAIFKNNENIVKLLLKNGADVNAPIGVSYIDYLSNEVREICSVVYDDYTPLHLAMMMKNEVIIDLLLDYNADVNAIIKHTQETPLHLAVQNKDEKSVILLSECGAEFRARTKNGKSILHLAAENDWPKLIEVLILKGGDVNDKTNDGETLLHISVEMGDESMVELLIELGADVNIKNLLGQTPLHIAAEFSLEIIEILLNNGAKIDEVDQDQNTPLSIAIRHEDLEIIEKILEYKPNLQNINNISAFLYAIKNYKHYKADIIGLWLKYGFQVVSKDTPAVDLLYNFVSLGNIKIVQSLLWNGLSFEFNTNSQKNDIILKAVMDHNIQMVGLLIEHGFNLNAIDEYGLTAMSYAIEHNDLEMLDLLLANGAKIDNINVDTILSSVIDGNILLFHLLLKYGLDINTSDAFGTTALHLATWNKNNRFIQLLLDKNASVNAKENSICKIEAIDSYQEELWKQLFTSPLHIAVSKRSQEICNILLENYAEINSKDGSGRTALHIACAIKSVKQKSIIKTLIAYGADISIFDNSKRLPIYYIYQPTCVCSIAFQNQYNLYSECECHLFEEDEVDDVITIFIKHIALLIDMEKYVDKENLNLLARSDFAEKFLEQCATELFKIKNQKIYANVTYYDILIRKSNSLAAFARNENIIQAFDSQNFDEKFPIYCDMIKEQFKKAKDRQYFLKMAIMSFNNLLRRKLPETITEYIFNFLCNNDLDSMHLAGKNYLTDTGGYSLHPSKRLKVN